MKDQEGIILSVPEKCPEDPYIAMRTRPTRLSHSFVKNEKLKRFLENDNQVLRFYCIWDDRQNMFGELREFVRLLLILDNPLLFSG